MTQDPDTEVRVEAEVVKLVYEAGTALVHDRVDVPVANGKGRQRSTSRWNRSRHYQAGTRSPRLFSALTSFRRLPICVARKGGSSPCDNVVSIGV